MSVTAAQGFSAAGVTAGLKGSGGRDVALVVNEGPLSAAAAVFTSNRAKANPIIWSERVIVDGDISAIILNSGGANCFTGQAGFEVAEATADAVARALGVSANNILVCSTGLIGVPLDQNRMLDAVSEAATTRSSTGGDDAAAAILTTDSHPKTINVTRDGWSIGGMAKGAGMLAPSLATMLVVITTDAALDSGVLDSTLRAATRVSFDRLDSDGCMSTNDQVTLMASGASGVTPPCADFQSALIEVCTDLAVQLMADAEGASHEITIDVSGAVNEADAIEVGRSVARNNLFKAAMFGNDANWGRVLAAIGTTGAEFDPYNVDVSMNGVRVCHEGEPDQPRELVDLSQRAVQVQIALNAGSASAIILTNDLTHDYVHENSAYSS